MPPIYWATDADYYDPDYQAEKASDSEFRNGVGKISAANAETYTEAIEEDQVDAAWITENHSLYQPYLRPIFLVNIDEHVFISNFYDIDYENHVAPGWKGIFDDPLTYMPDEIKAIWS